MATLYPTNVIEGAAPYVRTTTITAPALGTTTAVHAAVTDNGGTQTITTGITNPDVPRNVTATAGGTAADIKAISVTVTGTDAAGAPLTEILPVFTVNTAGTVVGSVAFKTVTSISIPAHDDVGATTSIGTGAKLGLGTKLSRDTIVNSYLGGTRESTRSTVVVSSSAIKSNLVTLNSALNATDVIIDFWQT
jgi:hypothetical protein